MKIVLVYGGKSAEHEVSVMSAYSLLNAVYYNYYAVQLVYINRQGYWFKGPVLHEAPQSEGALYLTEDGQSDGAHLAGKQIDPCQIKEEDSIIFPLLHGPNGEDGTIQGLFEILGVPYVGCGVLAGACGMDKIMTKYILQQAGVPQVPFVPVIKTSWKQAPARTLERCEGSLLYPMFVKPANLGSSVGISKAENQAELIAAIEGAFRYDRRVIVEQGVEAREIEIAVLGNDEVRTTVAGEIVKDVAFYDYESKYVDNQVTLQIPADIPQETLEAAQEYAKLAYMSLDGSGLSRCDFFLSASGELFLNELNTMPGFTPFSMYPLLWKEMGLNYGDLIEELIQLGLMRFKDKQQLQCK